MSEIKWKIENGLVYTQIGLVYLLCEPTETWYNLDSEELEPGGKWGSIVHIGNSVSSKRVGPHRKTLSKCKEDAVALACRLILDAQTIVDEQVRAFERKGLLVGDLF